MIEILQWTTLIASGAAALSRIPNLVRRKNRSIFYALALLTLAILLSINGPYLAIDALLGGTNVANLLLRFIIFGAIFFLALRIAAGFGDSRGVQLIRGRSGTLALGLISAVLVVCFVLMDTSGSSAGLVDVAARSPQNALLVEYYGAAGRAYPAYVCLAILPGMLRAIRSPLPALLRASAVLLAVGSIAVPLTLLFPVIPPPLGFLRFVLNYTAILCFVGGLALIWVASGRAGRRRGALSVGRRKLPRR
ncbi:MAG TPA: hypothetical protein VGK98_18465 [Arthrobacter sp.]|jgi:hypothetical protein|uniref:hypothetical protein n=1 Tax=Arthrobacter sp. TaxID=1667 RepID=UPI002F3E780B